MIENSSTRYHERLYNLYRGGREESLPRPSELTFFSVKKIKLENYRIRKIFQSPKNFLKVVLQHDRTGTLLNLIVYDHRWMKFSFMKSLIDRRVLSFRPVCVVNLDNKVNWIICSKIKIDIGNDEKIEISSSVIGHAQQKLDFYINRIDLSRGINRIKINEELYHTKLIR